MMEKFPIVVRDDKTTDTIRNHVSRETTSPAAIGDVDDVEFIISSWSDAILLS